MLWEGLDAGARAGPGSSISGISEAARREGGQERCGFFGILDRSGLGRPGCCGDVRLIFQ